MGGSSARRSALLKSLDQVIRKVTGQSVLLSEATAAKAGINSTDLECLDLLNFEGPSPPRRLIALTGLTTGAVTMLVDRLERAGFVRRTPNPDDRRSVLVEALPTSTAVLEPLFRPLARTMTRVNEHYSNTELAIVVDYLTRAYEAGGEHLRWLTHSEPVTAGSKAKGIQRQDARLRRNRS